MDHTKRCVTAMILAAGVMVSAGAASAAEPSEQMEAFFGFTPAQQHSIVRNAIIMTGVIASQAEPKIATCLDDWYSDSSEQMRDRESEIIGTMHDLPEYVPEAIILAVIEKACGKFKRAGS
ncbi:MAG: hypothetical protein ABJL67_12640 [Sulfitobacter sp.]